MIRFWEPEGVDSRDERGSTDKEHKMRSQDKFFLFAVIIIISMGSLYRLRNGINLRHIV